MTLGVTTLIQNALGQQQADFGMFAINCHWGHDFWSKAASKAGARRASLTYGTKNTPANAQRRASAASVVPGISGMGQASSIARQEAERDSQKQVRT